MNTKSRRSAFTLIEVLIVVVIMAVLAATILPQFSSSTKDAKVSTLKFNLHTLRSQIELYKMHHNGLLPDGTNNLAQLTLASDVTGTTGTAGTSFPYGPYVQGSIPVNPFTSSGKVTLYTGTAAPTASGAADAGYFYRASTGDIWVDDATYIGL